MIDAAQQWAQSCLVADGSVFTATQIWTPANLAEVRRAFIDRPDESGEDFMAKLRGQMSDATNGGRRLMAEMLWVSFLFQSNVLPETKRGAIREVWESGGEQLPDHPMRSTRVLAGIGSAGQGYDAYRWKELAYLVNFAEALKSRPDAQRREVLVDYDAFTDFIASVPVDGHRQLRHMLRYFSFPDRVEPMASNRARRAALAAFRNLSPKELKNWDNRQLDDALLALRRELEAAKPGSNLSFYESPLREKWLGASADIGSEGSSSMVAEDPSPATPDPSSDAAKCDRQIWCWRKKARPDSTPPASSWGTTGFTHKQAATRLVRASSAPVRTKPIPRRGIVTW